MLCAGMGMGMETACARMDGACARMDGDKDRFGWGDLGNIHGNGEGWI